MFLGFQALSAPTRIILKLGKFLLEICDFFVNGDTSSKNIRIFTEITVFVQ